MAKGFDLSCIRPSRWAIQVADVGSVNSLTRWPVCHGSGPEVAVASGYCREAASADLGLCCSPGHTPGLWDALSLTPPHPPCPEPTVPPPPTPGLQLATALLRSAHVHSRGARTRRPPPHAAFPVSSAPSPRRRPGSAAGPSRRPSVPEALDS